MSGGRINNKVRKQAIKLFGLGYPAAHIGKQLGVHPQTIRKWVKAAGVEKGSLIEQQIPDSAFEKAETIEVNLPDNLPLVAALNRHKEREAIKQAVQAAPSAAEQFQTLVAAKGIKLLSDAFEAPPRPKNVRDLKTLAEMVSDALGISKKGGSGGKLAIDLTVLTKPSNQLTIEADVIDGRERKPTETD